MFIIGFLNLIVAKISAISKKKNSNVVPNEEDKPKEAAEVAPEAVPEQAVENDKQFETKKPDGEQKEDGGDVEM